MKKGVKMVLRDSEFGFNCSSLKNYIMKKARGNVSSAYYIRKVFFKSFLYGTNAAISEATIPNGNGK